MRGTLLRAFGLLLALTTTAAAQDYPTRPVRLIIPFAPGGSVDIVARLIAAKLGDRLGQQVIPDNRGGAGGIIAMEQAVKAPADGYTLVLVSLAHAVNPSIYKVNYDPVRSVAFVASLGNGASVLTVHPSGPRPFGQGADRARQEQARRLRVRARGRRQLHPHRLSPVRDDGRHRRRADPVQGRRAGDDRRHGRPLAIC